VGIVASGVDDGAHHRSGPGPAAPPATRGRSALLDRGERDALQRLVIDLELGGWAIGGFEIDAVDPAAQQARRRRVETAFRLLDALGWTSDDPRSAFAVPVDRAGALVDALEVWRSWLVQAIDDVRRDRREGAPAGESAADLLATAEAIAAIDALLAQVRG
jgi:hypothetical protein